MAQATETSNINNELDNLIDAFQITPAENSIYAPHPRFSSFKSKPSKCDQESRRKAALENQKKRRSETTNNLRCLIDGNWNDVKDDDEVNEMEIEVVSKPGKYYQNQLMLSEWLVEVPDDFNNYIMVTSPVGKRVLVVAAKGRTSVYTKNGRRLLQFQSDLPGGNKNSGKTDSILDCIYNESLQTFFILDIMCWRSHPIYDSETEFRFYWLNTKLEENDLKKRKHKFVSTIRCDCTPENMQELIDKVRPEEVQLLDGFLFYHKKSFYTFGPTPLVGWLKPFMLKEILNLNIPEYLNNGIKQVDFIKDFDEKQNKHHKKDK